MTSINPYVKGLKTAAQIIAAVTTVIGAAGNLKDSVRPVLESEDGKKAAEKARGAFSGIVDRAENARDSFLNSRKAKQEEKEFAKNLKNAQQTVLANASRSIPIKEYLKLQEGDKAAASIVAVGLFDSPGCFALATYSKFDFDNDLTDYIGVYVDGGENVGEAICHACSRSGNPDVYADVKFEQNVHLYVYPCTSEELPTKMAALADLLQAEMSYNAPRALN